MKSFFSLTGRLHPDRMHVLPIVGCIYNIKSNLVLFVCTKPEFSRFDTITEVHYVKMADIVRVPKKHMNYLHITEGTPVCVPDELYTCNGRGRFRFLGSTPTECWFTTVANTVVTQEHLPTYKYDVKEYTEFARN